MSWFSLECGARPYMANNTIRWFTNFCLFPSALPSVEGNQRSNVLLTELLCHAYPVLPYSSFTCLSWLYNVHCASRMVFIQRNNTNFHTIFPLGLVYEVNLFPKFCQLS